MAGITERNINGLDTSGVGPRQKSSFLDNAALKYNAPQKKWDMWDSQGYPEYKRSALDSAARKINAPQQLLDLDIDEEKDDGLMLGSEADAWYQEFLDTIAPYLDLTEDEKRYYQSMSALMSSQGNDPREYAEQFLTSSAISNATGLDRNTVNANYDELCMYMLGSKEPLKFSTGARIINGWKTGKLYQDLYAKMDDYRDLFAQGLDEDSEEVKAIESDMEDINRQIEYYGNAVPNNWLVSKLALATEQLPYMLKGGFSSLAGGAVGALIAGPVGYTVGSMLGGFTSYFGDFRGQAFYEMKKNGVSTKTALTASSVDGLINAANEAALDTITGTLFKGVSVGKLTSNLFSKVFTKLAGKGAVKSFASRLGLYMLGQGSGEFLQEASQSLTSSAIAATAEYIDNLDYSKSLKNALSNAMEEGVAGFTVGTVFGLPGAVLATRADIKTTGELGDRAKNANSREAFINSKENIEAVKSMKLAGDGYTDSKAKSALGSLYDNMGDARIATLKGRADSVSGNAETKEGKKVARNQEKVRRTDSGKIRTQVNMDETYGNIREMSISFGDTIARKEGEKARSYGEMSIEFDSDSNTATISSLKVENGYETIAPEMVRTAIQQYMQDYDVKWDTDNEFDAAVKDSLVKNNPDGIEMGLRYMADKDSRYDARIGLKNDIKGHFRNLSDGEAMASAQIVDILAESYEMTIPEFLDRYAGGSLFAEDNGTIFQGRGENARGAFRPLTATQIASGLKGVIYAGENADVSTFNHELFHFAASIDKERRTRLTNAIKNAADTHKESLEAYISDHKEMFADNAMEILSSIKDNDWTIEQEEAITSLYEAYLSDPNKIVSKELKSVLDRIVDFMKRIYRSIRDNSLLNEDIARGFEQMMGFSNASNPNENARYQRGNLESEKTRLREKYSAMVREPKEEWSRKPVKEFFKAYKPEITEMLKEYPKVELEGVLMLEGMREKDMPFQKELIQSKLLKEILNENIILLPRYATSTIEETFGVTLAKGSFSDGLVALVDGDKYIEFKLTSQKGVIRNINEANNADFAFIVATDISDSFLRKLKEYSNNLKTGDLENIFLLDRENKGYFDIKIVPSPAPAPQNVSEEYELSAKKLVVSNLHPFDSNYMVDLEKVNPDALMDYDTYLSAGKTDVRFQGASLESEKAILRKKYSALVREPKEEWSRKPVKEFFKAYKPEITEMLKEYPKVELEGVLMLEGMDRSDMPFEKELIQANAVKEILGSNVILLPRYATNTLRSTFGVELSKGSFSDGLAALADGDKYIEFKLCGMKNFVQKTNEATQDSDIAFVAINGLSDDEFHKRIGNTVDRDGVVIYFIDTEKGILYKKNKENVTTLPMSSERIQGANIGLQKEPSVTKEYIRKLSEVNTESTMDYDTYLSADKTDVRYQRAYHGSGASFDRFDTSHIGEGEGNQFFGWGLYLTNSENIARDYAEKLGKNKEDIQSDIDYYTKHLKKIREERKALVRKLEDSKTEEYWANDEKYQALLDGTYKFKRFEINLHNSTYGEGKWDSSLITDRYRAFTPESIENQIKGKNDLIKKYQGIISGLKSNPAEGHNLYTVEIPDRNYIHWDRPLSDSMMNKIWKGLERSGFLDRNTIEWDRYEFTQSNVSGQGVYGYLSNILGGDKEASLFLNNIGIKGINYPADTMSGSRSKARNFVLFDGDSIEMVDKVRFQNIHNGSVFASNNAEAIAELKKYQGKDIVNSKDGLIARFGERGRSKMLSNKAREKSISNGFSAIEHNTAVANVPKLFEEAIKVIQRPDIKGGNKDLSILYYEKAIQFAGTSKTGYAKILVKSTKGIGNRIYTLELIGLEKSSRLSGELSEEERRALDSVFILPSEPVSVNNTFYQYNPYDSDTLELSKQALLYDDIDKFLDYFNFSEEGWPVIFDENEAREIYEKAHRDKKTFYKTELHSDAWLNPDVSNLSAEQKTQRFKEIIESDDGLKDFVAILRAGKRYFIDAGHVDIVSEAYGSGKMTRKRKWIPPVATVDAEARIYELASNLSDDIKNNAYSYAYAKDLTEQSLKSARTNILKNEKKYRELLSKVFDFFYQESYLQNELSLMTGGEGDTVRTDYLSLSEAWKQSLSYVPGEIREIESIEGEKLNPDAPVNGEMDLTKLAGPDIQETAEEPLDESLFPADTSELGIDKLSGDDAEKDSSFLKAFEDDAVLLGALSRIAEKDGVLPIDNTLMSYAEKAKDKTITASELEKARALIENAPRHYRDIFADIFNRDDLKASRSKTDLPSIERTEDAVESEFRNLDMKGRKKVSASLDKKVSDSIATGNEKMTGGVADEELRKVQEELDKLKSQKAEVDAELKKSKALVRTLKSRLEGAHIIHDDTIRRMTDREEADTLLINELRQKLKAEEKKVETREKWLQDYKETVSKKEKEQRELKKIRAYKIKLAKSLTREWKNSVDYRTVMPMLLEIRSKLDGRFIREWLYDPIKNPEGVVGGGTISYKELEELYKGIRSNEVEVSISPEELKETIGYRMWNRLSGEGAKPLNDWTIKELEELNDKLNEVWKQGKEIEAERRRLKRYRRDGYKTDIVNTLKETRSYDDRDILPGSEESKDNSFKARLRGAKFQTMRMQELAMLLDGDNGKKGTAFNLLVERVRQAQDKEQAEIEKRMKLVNEAMNSYGLQKAMDFFNRSFEVTVGDGITNSFTGSAMAYIWLSQYNDKARQAVTYGNLMLATEKGYYNPDGMLKYNPQIIGDDEVLAQVGQERYRKVLAQAKELLDREGMMPIVDAISADLWNKANGERLFDFSLDTWNQPIALEDHYIPIRRMDALGTKEIQSAQDVSLVSGNYMQKAKDGFLEEKQNFNPRHQKEVRLDLLGVWSDSVIQQEHLLSTGALLSDINAVFEQSKEVRNAVKRAYGKEMLDEITDYLQFVADPEGQKADDVGKVLSFLRGSTSMAYLSWKLSGIIVQLITSPAPFVGEASASSLFKAYTDMAIKPRETWEFVSEKSVMMKNRSANMIIQDIKERSGKYEKSKAKRGWNKFQETGMQGLEWVDRYCVTGGWLARYNDVLNSSLEKGLDTATAEKEAIASADEMVLRTQPTGTKTELARMFRSANPVLRILLQFQSALNVVYNNLVWNNVQDFKAAKKGNKDARNRIIGHAVGYVMSGVILGLMQDGFDDDDDKEDKARKMAYWMVSQGVESLPWVGSLVSEGVQTAITGKYSPNTGSSVLLPAVTDVVEGTSRVAGALSEDDEEKRMQKFLKGIEQLSYGLGLSVGAPVSAIKQGKRAFENKSLWPFLGRY